MKSNKSFWIFSELFYPDETSSGYYLTEIAKHLSQFNPINVVCGPADYEKNSNLKNNSEQPLLSVNINRVWIPTLNKNIPIQRLFRILILSISFGFRLIFNVKRGSKVLIVTNPAYFVPIASLISKFKKIELIILVHDVFPENLLPIKAAKSNGLFYLINLRIFNWAYKQCANIIVLGRDMKTLFEQKTNNTNSKIDMIENWSDLEDISIDDNKNHKTIYDFENAEKKIVIQFAGNIGRLQALDQILLFISKCNNPILHFVFIGEGAYKPELIKKANNLSNVTILDSFARNKQQLFLNAQDIGLVSLNNQMLGLGVPSKTYNLLAAGKPILYFGNKNSEIAQMVKEHNIGWSFELSEESKILAFLNSLSFETITGYGNKSKFVANNYYSKEIILAKYNKYINHES
jgi:glycosyltransferase involved in cell wall biosynthesis